MLIVIAVLATQGLEPGPIDAFRANFSATKVDLTYRYRCGFADGAAIRRGRLWTIRDVKLIETRELAVDGQWSCDGSSEYFQYGAPPEIAVAGRKALVDAQKTGKIYLTYVPSYEGIYNGEFLFGHNFGEGSFFHTRTLDARPVTLPPTTVTNGRGPFSWWVSYPFPYMLNSEFKGSSLARSSAHLDGHVTEVEIYRKDFGKVWRQVEISYDPSLGYLPRYARKVESFGEDASIHEYYLRDAQLCAAGGFVPIEWYTTTFTINRFVSLYPSYSHTTELEPRARSFVGHFKADTNHDRVKPVALERLDDVKSISAPGGEVPLSVKLESLNLEELENKLGARLLEERRIPLPSLDTAELTQFSERPRGYRIAVLVAGVAAIVVVGLIIRRRRRAFSAIFLLMLLTGCGRVGTSVVNLSAVFRNSPCLYDPSTAAIPLDLVLRNEGNQTLRILGGDGGCSCREVDRSRFPASLRPGEELTVAVRISPDRRASPQDLPFTFSTDHGVLGIHAVLYALARHQLNPEALSTTVMDEGEGWGFDLVHRAITKDGETKIPTELVHPANFTMRKVAEKQGRVSGAPGFSYLDTTYKATLTERSLGLHKAAFSLLGPRRVTLVESSAVWKRVPYLAAIPDRIALGVRPVRSFLRCPDEAVELTKVLAAPAGVDAVISSPREVTVKAIDGVPGLIDGVIVIGTTAGNRPPLKIQVVRYAPSLSK